jgi:DNA modification methylase
VSAATIADVLSGAARWCVVEGDCLDVMRGMADRSVAHVICDPPYEAEAHTKQRRVKTGEGCVAMPLTFAAITAEERKSAGYEFSRVATRWILAFCQVEAAMKWRDAIECRDADGLTHSMATYRRTCVWVKPDAMPQYSGDRPGMGYESIVACHRTGRSAWNGGGRIGVFTAYRAQTGPINGGVRTKNEHPTTKPDDLMAELVALFTDPSDLILDPFAGSGTTGVAALRLGRRCILIEKDPKYAALCRERMTAEESSSTLQAKRAGQEPLFAKETT